LFDRTSSTNELYVVHTHTPRFIASWELDRETEGLDEPVIRIQGGWAAVSCQWMDPYDKATFDMEEITTSLTVAWKLFNMPEPRIHPLYLVRGSLWTRDERLVAERVSGQLADPLGALEYWRGYFAFHDRPRLPIERGDALLLVQEHGGIIELIVYGVGPTMLSFKCENEPITSSID